MNTDNIAVTEQEEEAFEMMSKQSFNDIAEIFRKNRIACDGRVSCSVDDWNKVGSYIEQLEKEKAELRGMLKQIRITQVLQGDPSNIDELLERMK